MISQLIRKPHNELPKVERFRLLWRRSAVVAAASFVLGITQFFIIPRNGGVSEVLFALGGMVAVAALVCAALIVIPREPARAWSIADAQCAYSVALSLTTASCTLLIATLLTF